MGELESHRRSIAGGMIDAAPTAPVASGRPVQSRLRDEEADQSVGTAQLVR